MAGVDVDVAPSCVAGGATRPPRLVAASGGGCAGTKEGGTTRKLAWLLGEADARCGEAAAAASLPPCDLAPPPRRS